MVPIIEFSDMFCCEQLSPNESKQICDLKPYLEVRLYLGVPGLIFADPVGYACSPFTVPPALNLNMVIFVHLKSSLTHSPGETPRFARGKQNQHQVRCRLSTEGIFGRRSWFVLPRTWFALSQCGETEEQNYHVSSRMTVKLCCFF